MKFISNEDYKALSEKKDLKAENTNLKAENKRVKGLLEEKYTFIEEMRKKHELRIEDIQREHVIEIATKTRENTQLKESQEHEIAKKTAELSQQLVDAKRDKEIAEAKSNMLDKAFENLGFDVKDTKEIIEKLIVALGQKHTVQMVGLGSGK
jgi:uncharacterized membrane protein YqiK